MSLIKNGRFNDGFYTEAEVKIKRSDTSELLMAIRQAFAFIGIDQKGLDAMVEKIDPTIRQKRLPLPQKEEWKEYVKSASGSGLYVSIIKNKNNTYTIERSKDKTMFMAPDGIGENYCNIFITPDTPMQSLRNDLILNYFDIAGYGLNGTSIVSIIPASFVATKTKNIYTLNTTGIIETAKNQTQQPAAQTPPIQAQQPAATAQPQPQQPAQPQAPQTPQAQQQAQGGKTTWDQLKTMASKGQQFILNNTAYDGTWYLFKSSEPANFFGFPTQSNAGDYQVYPNAAWFMPDNEPFREHYDDINAIFEGVIKDGEGGVVKNIAPAIFAPDNSIEGKQKGRYKLIEKGIVEQEPYQPQK